MQTFLTKVVAKLNFKTVIKLQRVSLIECNLESEVFKGSSLNAILSVRFLKAAAST